MWRAFGGVGYAASAAKNAVQTVVQVQAPKQDAKGNDNKGGGKGEDNNKGGKGEDKKPDEDQYKGGKGCGDKNHEHENQNDCKKPPK